MVSSFSSRSVRDRSRASLAAAGEIIPSIRAGSRNNTSVARTTRVGRDICASSIARVTHIESDRKPFRSSVPRQQTDAARKSQPRNPLARQRSADSSLGANVAHARAPGGTGEAAIGDHGHRIPQPHPDENGRG